MDLLLMTFPVGFWVAFAALMYVGERAVDWLLRREPDNDDGTEHDIGGSD